MAITELDCVLTVYVPLRRWKDIVPLLPIEYTKQRADGYWEGEQEDINILTIYGAYYTLNHTCLALVSTLLDAGEQAVLASLDPARASIYSR